MSHNIQYYDYPENVDKEKVFADLANYVRHEDWQEGGHLSKIRWIPGPVLESRDAAEKYIEKHDNGWYDCLAVRYRQPKSGVQSKAYLDLQQRSQKAQARYQSLVGAVYASTVKAAFIGCKNCGSKLSRKYILAKNRGVCANFCPVCGADLRPVTTQERIKKAFEAHREILGKMEEEAKRMAKRNGEVRWLVKIEYHT